MDSFFLEKALEQAKKAHKINEVPVGCVLVHNNQILSKGYNQIEKRKNSMAHAEIMAIQIAQKKQKDWRLKGCVLYVTLEPCIMCVGAILHARIEKVVFGALDYKWGGVYSKAHLLEKKTFNHDVSISYLPHSSCSEILKDFFKSKRQEKKKIKA